MQKILVTGANGQMGSTFASLSEHYPEYDFYFHDKDTLDICNLVAVESWFETHPVDYCINCAAYTAVDKAEADKDLAEAVNVTGVVNLAKVCSKLGIPMIHFSTDYVYHNSSNLPYTESDPTEPKGIYAITKLEGENQLQSIHPKSMVIRTSWVYSNFGHNFVKTMLRLGREREQLTVVYDQIGAPTYAEDLVVAIMHIIDQVSNGQLDIDKLPGVYNYSNEGVCSWYDFAIAIFEISGIECEVQPISTEEYPTPASRPPFSVLNKSKFKTTFNQQIPQWREALKRMLVKEEY
ncbi:MAG: dTDP-4-dehydrorhamnose reductase [Bacteroidetes bacterium]|nr:MAG: dTDP-4-dehydrorhamnose reductase [Bacteroidota bacterium]